jgi:hypothetical protein
MFRQSNAAVSVITVGNGVEFLACHAAGTRIALQVRKEMRDEAIFATAAALDVDHWRFVLGRGLVPIQATKRDEVHLVFLAPEVRLLHISQLRSGRSNSRLLGSILNDVLLETNVVGEVKSNTVAAPACLTFVGLIFIATVCAIVTRKNLERGESFATGGSLVLGAIEAKAVSSAFLVVVPGDCVDENLQASRTGVVADSQVSVACIDVVEDEWAHATVEAVLAPSRVAVHGRTLDWDRVAAILATVAVLIECSFLCEILAAPALVSMIVLKNMDLQGCASAKLSFACAVWRCHVEAD